MNRKYSFNIFNFVRISGDSIPELFIACLLAFVLMGFSYLCIAGLVYCFCWGFSLPWSWKIAFGVWCGYVIIHMLLSSAIKNGLRDDD